MTLLVQILPALVYVTQTAHALPPHRPVPSTQTHDDVPDPNDTCLSPSAIQTASFLTGLEPNTPGIRPGLSYSATNPANFINFCAPHPLTNGRQTPLGSCNGIPMGRLPPASKMISSLITFPSPAANLPANKTFTVRLKISNLAAGFLTNPSASYYAAPQDLDDASGGLSMGHCHITIQGPGSLSSSSSSSSLEPPDPAKFAFFKGVDDRPAEPGASSPRRVCTMVAAQNHQPVLMPVAQRGAQDDCVRFSVA
ncbi:hypothetical protein QBC35DRAFT_518718 [Podospora australis]|uniref:Ubiquitin 3 binding protein But2 C-terminal domain-containing protein n=1 Tax=Podospora australis TaxID=1536484 RepID=A0AAN6WIC5_9PEZI|nr:hypothetical protein QBC35DRAFT_518718 [Podospora australis]